MPAVWICFEDASYDTGDGLWTANFSAVCVARNARNEKAARRGAGAGEVGAYQIGKDVAGLLDGQDFGIAGITAMRCLRIDAPFNSDFEKTRAAIMLLTFQAKWDATQYAATFGDVPRIPAAGQLPEAAFTDFEVGWDMPPSPSADAADTITLQGS